jgi:hypothetical protein
MRWTGTDIWWVTEPHYAPICVINTPRGDDVSSAGATYNRHLQSSLTLHHLQS